ncbi:nicotinate mononucleotide-dependent phosphoribosyltransferase CobT [Caldisphaera sp.]|uniref:nicotinate mononucleotide-dependent phosphoribosyltransferase CobT n=1 Tax=Caldisphaera sp. TaxID=2060322 RepID=UPI0025C104AC|nr:TIGR00303 family protein [Caldisphaera sp.]
MNAVAIFVGGSTKTSTINGVSIAGSSSEETLYTPTLDLEYIINGMPLTKNEIPVTPNGLPTPAVITRALLRRIKIPYFAVDSGLYIKLKVPHIKIPSAIPGNNIELYDAMQKGTAKSIFEESKIMGEIISNKQEIFLLGESIPGGTTTAASIIEGLGFKAVDFISSASPNNPRELKKKIIENALKRISKNDDVFTIIDKIGDPVHISLAGFAAGALKNKSTVLLAGGTQMGAVLSILYKLNILDERIKIATTKWIANDKESNIFKLIEQIDKRIEIIVSDVDFSDAKYDGLKFYEKGFVKEGVGAGGVMVLSRYFGLSVEEIKKEIYNEYERLISIGKSNH